MTLDIDPSDDHDSAQTIDEARDEDIEPSVTAVSESELIDDQTWRRMLRRAFGTEGRAARRRGE